MSQTVAAGVTVLAPDEQGVLTPEALDLVGALEREFGERREQLLLARAERQERIAAGELPDFLEETRSVREGDWSVAPVPADLQDRRVEITGPAGDRKMVINAFNSGARTYMADFEDANSPTWENVVGGQQNLTDAIERTISVETRGQELPPERGGRRAPRPAARLAPPRAARRGGRAAGLREPVRLRRLPPAERRAPARARQRAVLLPPEAREPPRGAALERRLPLRAGPARAAAGHDQGNRPRRDDPRRVRDGRDPVRAPRALGRAQRGALGLHLLGDQEVPRPRGVRAPGPRAGDDDGAVHARVHRAPGEDDARARGPRDGRDGRVHPQPPRPRGERDRARARARGQAARVRRRVRRDVGRASGSRRCGRSRSSTPCSASARTSSSGSVPTCPSAPPTFWTSPPRPARSRRTAYARTSRSGSATSPPGSPAPARPRSTT